MKLSRVSTLVLKAFVDRPGKSLYGYEIMQIAGISSGTMYPLLLKLEEQGLVASNWENADPTSEGRPRRRLYRITAEGQRTIADTLTAFGWKGAAA